MYKTKETNYLKAKSRVDRLRGFYIHLMVYCIVNTCITIYYVIRELNYGLSIEEIMTEKGLYVIWGFWGIGLALHAFSVFGLPLILGKNWEEEKIEKYMEEDRSSDWK